MDPQTVSDRLDQLQLVDVRYEKEWQAGHIEGAVHIPEDDLEDRLDELDRDRPIVTVCRAGTRSEAAAEWLRTQGFDAQNLDGGMLGWKWAGLPMTGKIVEPDPRPELEDDEMQRIHHQFIEIALAVQERFGVGAQPSEEEIRGFLKERLVSQGRTPEEADKFLAEMDGN
jgi:rhodanese-related sulfurtransferase